MNITKQPQKTKHTQHPANTPKTLRVVQTTHVNTTNTPQTTLHSHMLVTKQDGGCFIAP
jgi:hypothetical protein